MTGRMLRHRLEQTGNAIADQVTQGSVASGDTIRLSTRAMACDFSVILNPDPQRKQVIDASDALDLVHAVENKLTVYREQSDLIDLNRQAVLESTEVDQQLFCLLQASMVIARETSGAFTPAAGQLNRLWRRCRTEKKLPDQEECQNAVRHGNYENIELDESRLTCRITDPQLLLDFSGMGKGEALDRVAAHLDQEQVANYLIHGGHSSILARGSHSGRAGWVVGIRHPQSPGKRVGTIEIIDQAFSASGSGVQFFRQGGQRYGHIFDPRSGWPVDHHLSVVVLAPSAAVADALSTAFYVMTTEEVIAYCEAHQDIGLLLFPQPRPGKRLEPISINIDSARIHWC